MPTVMNYINVLNVSGIVIESEDWREEKSGYQDEHTNHKLVCRDSNGNPCRMVVCWTEKFLKYSKKYRIESKISISEDEYARILEEHGGAADERARAAERLDEEAARVRAAAVPRCPVCGASMRLRTRRSDNSDFWGCSRYPDCKGTKNK